MMPRFVELNHMIEDGMEAYPGFPSPKISALLDHEGSRLRYEGKAEFYLSSYELCGNLATYLDSPFHRYPGGDDLSRVPLEAVAGLPGLVVDAVFQDARTVDAGCTDSDMEGKAVLIRTGWDSRWGTKSYWEPGPHLSHGLIDRLVRVRPPLVGVDFWNVDDTGDPVRPAHTSLLAAGVLIVENLTNLAALPREGFRFHTVPLRIVGGASFPVRAFAEVG